MSAPDSGLIAAVILAGGVTALVAIVMMVVRQYRAAQLTAGRGALSVSLGLAIMALAGLGIVALSPIAAQASTTSVGSTTGTSTTGTSVVDVQLPTLPLGN
jgi:phage gp45-like